MNKISIIFVRSLLATTGIVLIAAGVTIIQGKVK